MTGIVAKMMACIVVTTMAGATVTIIRAAAKALMM